MEAFPCVSGRFQARKPHRRIASLSFLASNQPETHGKASIQNSPAWNCSSVSADTLLSFFPKKLKNAPDLVLLTEIPKRPEYESRPRPKVAVPKKWQGVSADENFKVHYLFV